MPLFEHFTASSCPPCATINSTVFTPQFIEDNTAVGTVIRYQVNWPGAGDPYYTEEVGTRVSYYGVGAVPSVFLNGSTVTLSTTASLQANLDAEAAKSAYFEMDATHAVDVAGQSISLNIDITPYVTDGGYTVHAVVIENETYDNASTNGETEFQHVTMKMVPGANGTQVDFVDGELESLEFTADLSGTNVEEYTDLSVVAFIQKNATKQISQSTYSVGAPIEFYTLNFTVTDGENPHEGATINIWDKELTTDASGLATVYIPEGTWNYTAQIEGYSTVEDSVVVDGADVSEDVVLARYALNYTVTANGEAVEGATITVAGSDLTTDVDGFATIEVVNGFYSYTIVKEGFPDYQEVVVVEGADIDIPVSLTGATMLTKAQLQVYPNPSNGVFKVTVDGVYTVQVLNNVGQVVYEETIDTNSSVDLSDLSSGMYVVSVKNDEKVATESIIIR
ncbi:MAG: T9SS type A sorting domain-containing protein [Salinivirgaceae bacterium]|jgi:phage gp37-like protein|nr:T9SS type A sorting domain-containing protein [Salinivirgaceae bacterium]